VHNDKGQMLVQQDPILQVTHSFKNGINFRSLLRNRNLHAWYWNIYYIHALHTYLLKYVPVPWQNSV